MYVCVYRYSKVECFLCLPLFFSQKPVERKARLCAQQVVFSLVTRGALKHSKHATTWSGPSVLCKRCLTGMWYALHLCASLNEGSSIVSENLYFNSTFYWRYSFIISSVGSWMDSVFLESEMNCDTCTEGRDVH